MDQKATGGSEAEEAALYQLTCLADARWNESEGFSPFCSFGALSAFFASTPRDEKTRARCSSHQTRLSSDSLRFSPLSPTVGRQTRH